MKKENKVSASEMLKNELGLTKAESLFCDLYINGGREFAGQHCKCYREAFQDSGSGVSLKSRRLLGKPHISERIKKLSEQQQTDTEAIAVKLQVTETLKAVMEETSTAKYKDKWGMDLSPAPLRAVAVNAAKALMDLYPIKHAQEAKLKIDLSHSLLWELAEIRKNENDLMPYLRPDAKSQVTIEYDDNGKPLRIDTIVVSTQHDEFITAKGITQEEADLAMQKKIAEDVKSILIPRVKAQYPAHVQALFNDDIIYHVNPTGKFVIGGPHGDTGLTGRKIIVDTYGGKGAHGGGAFSGKDPSKVDRSAAYAARHIAKNLVAAGVADEMLVQVSYAIGVAKPMNIFVNTFGRANVKMTDGEIAEKIWNLFDMRPKAIEERLKLRNPIYLETASYGHMGRKPQVVTKTFTSRYNPEPTICEVELFTWEKLDYVDKVKEAFGL